MEKRQQVIVLFCRLFDIPPAAVQSRWASLLDSAAASRKRVRVNFDYDAQEDTELTCVTLYLLAPIICVFSLRDGEIVSILGQDDPGWWKGEVHGKVGMFPSNY